MVSFAMEKKSINSQFPENDNATGNSPKKKGVLVWVSVCVLMSVWMFFLGILVGRGTAPVQFDTQSLQKELLALKKAAVEKTLRQYERDSKNADERKGVVFYDVLKRSGDGPDPQWTPRPTRPLTSEWPPELPAPSVPQGPPAVPKPSGTSEPPGASEIAKLPAPPPAQSGAGAQKPVMESKDPNLPVRMKVVAATFKKPEANKKPETVKLSETVKVQSTVKIPEPARVPEPVKVPEVATAPEPAKAPETPKFPETAKLPEKFVPGAPPSGNWTIQVAAMKDTAEADRIVAKLKQQGYPASRLTGEIIGKGLWHRIRIGPYPRREEADGVVARLTKEGLSPIAINTGGGKE
ncbi:MAG: SPOR domain-containing protein [Pseudomonadota bacterium]